MDPLARRRLGRTDIEVTQLGLGGAGLGDLFDVVEDADASARRGLQIDISCRVRRQDFGEKDLGVDFLKIDPPTV